MTQATLDTLIKQDYQHGFVTDIEMDTFPSGLSEDVIKAISAKKNEPPFMLEWRLKAYRHWLTLKEPHWAPHAGYTPIDYQALSYFSSPRFKTPPKSLEEIDPELLRTYEKLAFLCESKRCWPVWLSMPYLIAYL